MEKSFDVQELIGLYGSALPLALLLLNNGEDQRFIADLYIEYEHLMYKVAWGFFRHNRAEVEDAVQNAVMNLCRNCETLRAVKCNKRAAYIVSTVRNVSISRLRELARKQGGHECAAEAKTIEQLPAEDDVEGFVLDRVYAVDLLNSFSRLSEKDRKLIRMLHIDKLGFDAIMEVFGYKNEGAARTAASRAKKKLILLAMDRKWEDEDV